MLISNSAAVKFVGGLVFHRVLLILYLQNGYKAEWESEIDPQIESGKRNWRNSELGIRNSEL
jgi:hypothetical protein